MILQTLNESVHQPTVLDRSGTTGQLVGNQLFFILKTGHSVPNQAEFKDLERKIIFAPGTNQFLRTTETHPLASYYQSLPDKFAHL